jgi:hypothetical protein
VAELDASEGKVGLPLGRVPAAIANVPVWLPIVMLIVGFGLLPPAIAADDLARADALRQLTDGVMPELKFSLIQPLISVPIYWILDTLGLGDRAITTIPLIWLAGWCLLAWRLLSPHRSQRFIRHLIALSVASMLGAYIMGFNGEVFSALALTGGLMSGRLGKSPFGRGAGWTLLVIGAANTPALVVAAAAIAVVLSLQQRQLRYLALVPGAIAVVMLEASWATGGLTLSKYSDEVERGTVTLLPWGEVVGFGWPLWSGLLAVLFSFGRGLVFHLPLWVVGPSKPTDEVTRVERALWAGTLVLIPLYAKWWAWYGGVSFGPRFFMLGTVPLAMAAGAAIERTDRTAARSVVLCVAIVMSAWVAIAGTVFGVTAVAFDTCVSGGTFLLEPLCWYTPEYSGLWMPLWEPGPIGRRDVVFIVLVAAAVLPSLTIAAAPVWSPARRAVERAAASVRGPWRL